MIVTSSTSGGGPSSSGTLGNGKKTNNYWANNLNTIVNAKIVKKVRTKGEAI